jgi:hypothetical protein
MTQMSSMQEAVCGSRSLTSTPDLPCLLNLNGDGRQLTVRVRTSDGCSNGSGLPAYSASLGLGSNRSMCDGPPDMNRKMIRLALGVNIAGRTASGLLPKVPYPPPPAAALASAPPATKSSASSPASPSMPNPFANRRSICRREGTWGNCGVIGTFRKGNRRVAEAPRSEEGAKVLSSSFH